MRDLRPATKEIVDRVETVTGRPIQFLRDDRLAVLAAIHMARKGASYHVLRYKPSNDPLDYFVAYQVGFILRLYEVPADERYDFAPNEVGKSSLETLLTAGQPLTVDEKDALPHWVSVTLRWALLNLRSLPIGMRIDEWLLNEFPDLRDLVIAGMSTQQQLNANVLSQRIGKLSVPTHLLAPNAAYALLADRLLDTTFSAPYGAAGAAEDGRALLGLWDETPRDALRDRELVDRWAKSLGMSAWYKWIPFRP